MQVPTGPLACAPRRASRLGIKRAKCDKKRPWGAYGTRAFSARVRSGTRVHRSADRSASALERLLDRLVGFLGELGIHAADLRHLMHVAVVGALGEARLDLDGLLDRLGGGKLLEGGGAFLEGLLRVVGDL